MTSFCCFMCPKDGRNEAELTDSCPSCGRQYGFPLHAVPKMIGDRRVVTPLGRGFYAATYVVERVAGLSGKSVLKVTPKSFYEFFKTKNFELECKTHERVAEGTEHLVKIRDMRTETVSFGADQIECCIAELDFIPGHLLTDYFDGTVRVTAAVAAQVAIDLLRLKEELERKKVFHNDLHAQNIIVEELSKDRWRADAVNPKIRTVAIDLGSVTDESKSDPGKQRLGDIRWIGDHIGKLIDRLLTDPDAVSDHDFRLASALQGIFHALAAPAEHQRLPAAHELIDQIRTAYEMLPRHSWRPWKGALVLSSFGSYYNAQTLQSWHVPRLLVDPEGAWLRQISTPGPQVITGMRGCGKTMLLRALQFHARASQSGEDDAAVVKRIQEDNYIGLFVSAQRLLDGPGEQSRAGEPFARLLLAYALEAVRSLMHLKDMTDRVNDRAHKLIANVVRDLLSDTQDIVEVVDLDDLDIRLNRCLVRHSREQDVFNLAVHPNEAFSQLANAIRASSEIWSNAQVLFLLDDVSTRYLQSEKISQLLSALLFQSPICAFKITSEIQTMELELTTPGSNLRAREGRDLAVFDLGSEVYDRIKGRQGKQFVEQILAQRAAHFSAHPPVKPSQLLGDINLEEIAREITQTSSTSARRKEVYRGITALAHVCVGDIGDVISLYERIIKASDGVYPIPARTQSDCFQDHCSHRLYDLNRRGGKLIDAARSFAEASYELLVKSAKEAKAGSPTRLRQYASIYVRVTAGDTDRQRTQLRDLIDAGVFVFTGGKPRTKTKDSDPISQFKLTFRRIYGLTNFIGLAERDRFELSGSDLEEWLSNPANGKEVLLRNLGVKAEDEPLESLEAGPKDIDKFPDGGETENANLPLFRNLTGEGAVSLKPAQREFDARESQIAVEACKIGEIKSVDSLVLGLGFEERTLKSAERLFAKLQPCRIYAIAYSEPGNSETILEAAGKWGGQIEVVPYEVVIRDGLDLGGRSLVDVTGLAKPAIFHAVRNCLRSERSVLVAHTQAKSYYPTEAALAKLLTAEEQHNRRRFFEALSVLLTGEKGPYRILPLLSADADETRRTVLTAFASPKHERLLSLIESRVIDRLEIIAPRGDTARNKVARHIAEIAATDSSNSEVTFIDSDDLIQTIGFLSANFKHWYTDHRFNFEVGLTGSKMEAVAAAAISSVYKMTQCWYVRPKGFDAKRFTKGSGATRIFKLSVGEAGS